jgi:hypothetical protein
LFALLTLLLLAEPALAYVGPAPGPEFIGYFASLIGFLFFVFSALLLWPLHALRRCFRRAAQSEPVPPIAAAEVPVQGDCPQQ